MTTTAPAPSPTVTGDGTTARSRAAGRWRRARWTVLVLSALALTVLVMAVSRPATSTVPYAPDNARPDGARAVAEVLADQGVDVRYVTTVADALGAAGPGSTLLVTPAPYLLGPQADALAGTEADLVVAGADQLLVTAASGDVLERFPATNPPTDPVHPGCDVPAAVAAGTVVLSGGLAARDGVDPDVTLCWPTRDGAVLASVRDGDRDVTLVDDASFLRNDTVLDEGDAALALHLLGTHTELVWLVQDPLDTTTTPGSGPGPTGSMLPPWAGVVGLWALLVVVVAAVWRARRLGPLVAEPLPVVVRASESTRGRARLYRRARSRGHAAAGLRASTAERVARRLGLPRSADPTTLTDAVARATARPAHEVAALLYGPPPTDEAQLTELAHRLDTLESEVHRS
ncbi:DUF4350 domain-containing protein [Isoptericola sp. BMS4]|uniref:DUF4350 domain-containing protein n=1 Tax=Isoptericola sp. BMS4 TaxID=2527875 RepID=UPI001F108E45|nr:DUF4350 domain-containing protein [Isoptericola sp. BMS4]